MRSLQVAHFIAEDCIPKYILSRQYLQKPYIIGIAGTSPAVGKTTIASMINIHLGSDQSCYIDLDNWIVVDRTTRMTMGLAGVDPYVWNIEGLAKSLDNLIVGKNEISEPKYDHTTGIPKSFEKIIRPSNVIILAGATCLWDAVRSYLNFSICIHAKSEEDEKEMILSRNTKERNYSTEEAKIDYEVTKIAYSNYIMPYAKYSDMHLNVNKLYEYSIDHKIKSW